MAEDHLASGARPVPGRGVTGVRQLAAVRRIRVVRRANEQGGVISRREAYLLGLTRAEVRAQIRAERWQRVGRHCLCVHNGPLTPVARQWAAVLEAGPRAHLDGTSALIASGLEHFTEERIRVSVPKGARIRRRRRPGMDLRETRRFDPEDVVCGGVPRSRPAVAAIRGALWATSDRQATLVVTMAVQQGLCRVEELARELLRVKRDRRRLMLAELVMDLAGGVGSLGELDFLRGCRSRGVPEPDAQVVRRTRSGRYYLDFRWNRWRVVVEVDGIQHAWAQNLVQDAIRHNQVALEGDTVLRLPLLGLRLCADAFFDQVRQALLSAGWEPAARHTG
jgi:hypothetical protein